MGTPTATLELIKLILNSVLSRPGAKFACFAVKKFYLATPMDRSEYARIKIEDIPEDFINEYNLLPMFHNGWIYFEMVRECYGLPQSSMLVNNLLRTRLNKNGYFEAATTPGLWKHQWRPIQLCLIVDNLVIEYVGERHIHHLRNVLKQHYEITEDWKGTKFGGINIKWNYAQKHAESSCRLCIKDYIKYLLL